MTGMTGRTAMVGNADTVTAEAVELDPAAVDAAVAGPGHRLGTRARRRLKVGALVFLIVAGATAGGRALLAAQNPRGSSAVPPAKTGAGAPGSAGIAPTSGGRSGAVAGGAQGLSSGPATTSPNQVVATPVQPVGPDVVRTATVGLQVGKGTVTARMSKVADIATADGGYIDSSSLSGGTPQTSPVSGQLEVRVPATDFGDFLNQVASFGKLSSEQVSGQDVTGQVAENAATIEVLQQEVNLLQSKLSQATDINTFLQIEGQLAPVQQQLQQLQSQQAVLQGSVAFATVTVDLAAPGAPVPVGPSPRPHANTLRSAWHYASHNTLVVLDGLAVGAGWALPLLVLAGLGWLVVARILRRRRPGVTPA